MPASIPSPSQGVWNLGPLPLRGYALCIIIGIVLAVLIADRRYRARGGRRGLVGDVAIWAVPFGIIGGRLYHVATSWQPYFGNSRASNLEIARTRVLFPAWLNPYQALAKSPAARSAPPA